MREDRRVHSEEYREKARRGRDEVTLVSRPQGEVGRVPSGVSPLNFRCKESTYTGPSVTAPVSLPTSSLTGFALFSARYFLSFSLRSFSSAIRPFRIAEVTSSLCPVYAPQGYFQRVPRRRPSSNPIHDHGGRGLMF